MLKKLLVSLTFIFSFLISIHSQTGSGTFTFQPSAGHLVPINATATNLLNNAITYSISGNTNSAIAFSNYNLSGTLGVSDILLSHNFKIINPNSKLQATLNVENANSVKALVVDATGKLIATPKVINLHNGTVEIIDELLSQPNGLYFVQVHFDSKQASFKFLKNNMFNTRFTVSKTANKSSLASKNAAEPNYRISWPASQGINSNTGSTAWTLEGHKDVEITSGSGNNLLVDNIVTYSTDEEAHGNLFGLLNGIPQSDLTAIIESTTENYKDTIQFNGNTFKAFQGWFVRNGQTTGYNIKMTSDLGSFLPTDVTKQIAQGNNNILIDLIPIPNEQDITFTILDYQNLTTQSGVTVELLDANDDSVLDTQVSDTNGEVFFDNVPGEGTYKTRTSKNGHYTKTVGTFITPLVDTIDEMTEEYNTTTIPLQNYSDGSPITGEQANKYRLLAVNTELLHGRENLYLANVANRQFIIDRINHMNSEVGFEGATTFHLTPFGTPTTEQINNYNQYGTLPYGNSVIGTDAEPDGTDTNPIARTNDIYPQYSFNANPFKLGPTNAEIDHEKAQKDGFEQIAQGAIIPLTCLDSANPSELSMYDIPNMRIKLKNAANHFVELFNGKPAEYNFKTFDLSSQ